ncbi:Aconitase htyD [Exophiala dermatitidis]
MTARIVPQQVHLDLKPEDLTPSQSKCILVFEDAFQTQIVFTSQSREEPRSNLIVFLGILAESLRSTNSDQLAAMLEEVIWRCKEHPDFGGYGFSDKDDLQPGEEGEIIFLFSAYLEAFKHAARASQRPAPLSLKPPGRRSMTMTEKIFAFHDVSQRGYVRPGDIIQVDVDWVIASELSWQGMERVYSAIGRPGIFRNDRFWLAGDHRVEPPLYNEPKVKALMDNCRKAKTDFKMTEFQGFNYTIMHTEFVRERAQPGMLIIGADSHTCSAGAVSCLAIGMGATDVCMPLVTGQTWFTVPKTVQLRMINKPPRGVGGKDTILYILKQFKRNTIASDRVVEFTGPGMKYLSCDARFAISNMCTEFGAVTAIFESDERTVDFIEGRRLKRHKSESVYFKADPDAEYAATVDVDLSEVRPFIAINPSPDNVVPVNEVEGTSLDGCFIGACTTAEEDLVIGALVLRAGLDQGLTPVPHGRRLVVPGSKPIRRKLEQFGLLDVYRRAGFKIGVPGCSMCVGQGVDQAAPGEVWLSSQNRNFKNRMGPGSHANLGSAATVAVSSFSMKMTDPTKLLELIDMDLLERYLGYQPFADIEVRPRSDVVQYSEPYGRDLEVDNYAEGYPESPAPTSDEGGNPDSVNKVISGKVLRLGDFIDTDAIIPSNFLASCTTNEALGDHCMEFFMPEFRQRVKDGFNVVVGGHGFGCGSSRDVAVNALLGCGVKCVIARSFAFIYARNQPNIGLLGIVIEDESFYLAAQDGREIRVDLERNSVRCGAQTFKFSLSQMEKQLIAAGGLTEAFRRFGTRLFDVMCQRREVAATGHRTKDIESF